ncbi:MAG TPA: hypothetical protein VNQ73_05490 [Ilumatobacter sp.]|nr:hypothetical protein [Ilumatobacter sp.]
MSRRKAAHAAVTHLPSSRGSPLTVARTFVSRALEALFRRWWLYLVPIVLFAGIGVALVDQRSTEYRSFGVLRVSGRTVLSEITQVGANSRFGYETPAAYTSREINAVLGTEAFIESVAERAGLGPALVTDPSTAASLRDSIWASASSDLLVQVNARAHTPDLAQAVARATVDSYLQWQIDDGVSDSHLAEEFFLTMLEPYQDRLDAARDELQEYVARHPGPGDLAERPLDEQLELGRLTSEVDRADDQLATATQALADARLASAQTEAEVSARIRTIDPPYLPDAPEARRRQDALLLMLMLIAGSIISAAAVAASALLDRTVRYPDETETHLDVPVLIVVPSDPNLLPTAAL